MVHRLTKNTLGQNSGDGVIVAKSTFYPVGRTAVASAVGTEAVPVVSGSSQVIEYKVAFANPSGASSVWFLPCPAGKWQVTDVTLFKTAGLGVVGDLVTIKSVKSGTTSASLFYTTGDTALDVQGVVQGGIVKPDFRLDSAATTLDSSLGDKLEVTLAKAGGQVACELTFKLVLV